MYHKYCNMFSDGKLKTNMTPKLCLFPVYSKEDINQFPCNTSVIEDMCQTEQFQSNSTHLCSCCNNLLQSLLRERDLLQDKISQFSRGKPGDVDDMQIFGSGSNSLDFLLV